MADFKVIETNMKGTWTGVDSWGGAKITQGWLGKTIELDKELVGIQPITEENQKSLMAKVGWSVVGGVLTGGIGAIAGFVFGGNKKEITFIAELTEGRKFIGSTKDTKLFQRLCGYALKNEKKKL